MPARSRACCKLSVVSTPNITGTPDNLQQALERAGIKSNLGWSYALQALEMGSLMGALAEG